MVALFTRSFIHPAVIPYALEMAGITLWDCVREFSVPVELLDNKITDEHIREVSRFLQWRRVAPYLKLNDSEIEAVDLDGNNEEEKRYKSLLTWKRKFAFRAIYRSLIEALLECGRADHAEEVCKLLASLTPQKGGYITSCGYIYT